MSQVPPKKTGLARVAAATRYSVAGLRACFLSEEAFRIEASLGLVLVPIALWLGETPVERVLLVFSVVLVLLIELLNTAIESVINRVGLEYNELSKQAKDVASAAVFVSLLFFVFVWAALLA